MLSQWLSSSSRSACGMASLTTIQPWALKNSSCSRVGSGKGISGSCTNILACPCGWRPLDDWGALAHTSMSIEAIGTRAMLDRPQSFVLSDAEQAALASDGYVVREG